MAQSFGISQIRDAQPYWYERSIYTSTITLAATQISNVFSVQGWQPLQIPTFLVGLDSLAISQDPNVQIDLTYDRTNFRSFADHYRPDLRPVDVNRWALNNVSLTLTNRGTSPTQGTELLYSCYVWRMPIALKVLLGYALSADEQSIAKSVGLDLSPVAQQGTFPIPLSAIIERTYSNRQVRGPLEWAGPAQVPQTQALPFLTLTTSTNELLVVRNLYAEADPDYGIRLQVDRDGQQNYLDVDASFLSGDGHGIDLFLPAKQGLSFKLVANQTAPAAIPVRLSVWHLSLSSILRVRLGQAQQGDLVALYGNEIGQALFQRIVAGVK
jgi:hypothetical protein